MKLDRTVRSDKAEIKLITNKAVRTIFLLELPLCYSILMICDVGYKLVSPYDNLVVDDQATC